MSHHEAVPCCLLPPSALGSIVGIHPWEEKTLQCWSQNITTLLKSLVLFYSCLCMLSKVSWDVSVFTDGPLISNSIFLTSVLHHARLFWTLYMAWLVCRGSVLKNGADVEPFYPVFNVISHVIGDCSSHLIPLHTSVRPASMYKCENHFVSYEKCCYHYWFIRICHLSP